MRVILVIIIAMLTCRVMASGYLGMSLPASFRAFTNTSPWNTAIPASPEVDPNSQAMISTLKAKAPYLGVDYQKWTTPVHVIDSAQAPKVSVYSTRGTLNPDVDPDANGIVDNVPMPSCVWPDPQSDGHMVMVDPVVGKSWEFSKFSLGTNNQYWASTVTIWNLSGTGYRTPFLGPYWWTQGSTGSGVPWIGGIIRPEEIQAGEIRHAILCAIPTTRFSTVPGQKEQLCIPACRTDGWGIGTQYIPEGARLQLDPNLNLDSLKLSAPTRIVAKAMQRYGMIVSDSSTSFKTYLQNLGPGGGTWTNYPIQNDIYKIPVSSFRVLRCNLVTRK